MSSIYSLDQDMYGLRDKQHTSVERRSIRAPYAVQCMWSQILAAYQRDSPHKSSTSFPEATAKAQGSETECARTKEQTLEATCPDHLQVQDKPSYSEQAEGCEGSSLCTAAAWQC